MKKILFLTSFLYFIFLNSLLAVHPTALNVTQVGANDYEFSWATAVNCPSGSTTFKYRINGTSAWTTQTNALSPFTLTLSSQTDYEWTVKCAGSPGQQTVQNLSTLGSPPAINTIIITDSIDCFGGTDGEVTLAVTQSTPTLTNYKAIIGYDVGGTFVSFQATAMWQSTNVVFNVHARDWVIRLVDSLTYYDPQGNNPNGTIILGPNANTGTTDWTGVFDQSSFNMPHPPQLQIASSLFANLCAGDCLAENVLNISGGTQPYNYTFDSNPIVTLADTAISDTISGLCQGNYSLTISDVYGCTPGFWNNTPNSFGLQIWDPNWFVASNADFSITDPSPIIPAGSPYQYSQNYEISCTGFSDGFMVDLQNTTGGNPYSTGSGYQYSWEDVSTGIISNFGDSSSIDSLPAGDIIVYYQDQNGCTTSSNFTLAQPLVLTAAILEVRPPSCYGIQDGEIEIIIQDGAGGYAYSLDGTTSVTQTNSNSGAPYTITPLYGDSNYVITITDGNGCSTVIDTFMSQPTQITYDVLAPDTNGFQISCFGAGDGEITFTNVSGGNIPYQYSIDGGASVGPLSSFLNLAENTYNLRVVDNLNCFTDTVVQLTSPGPFSLNPSVTSNYNGADVSCFGYTNGSILVTSTNGVNNVSYEFNSSGIFSTTDAWSNLGAANYVIEARDENGCAAITNINIVDPPGLTAVMSSTDEYCNGQDGTATATVIGGTGVISYSWDDSNTQNTATATALSAGTYSCDILDVNGCNIQEIIDVQADLPFEIILSSTTTCPGQNTGSVSVVVNPLGGNTVNPTYSWIDINGNIIGSTDNISNLGLGTYTVTVNDVNLSCSLIGVISVDTAAVSVMIDTINITQISCHDANDGQLVIHAIGGSSPYEYQINGSGWQLDSVYGAAPNGLAEGTYLIEVRDASGCQTAQSINIINPDILEIDTTIINPVQCYGESNASIQNIIAIGGNPPYQYSVNGGLMHTNMSYFINYSAGLYTVEVRDANNCYTAEFINITEPPLLEPIINPSLWNNYEVRCFEDSLAYADITNIGGVSPYYNICINSLGDTVHQANSSMIDSLTADSYSFYVIDALGCTYTESIVYDQPSLIQHNFIPTHVTCTGWSNGSLIDSVYGGVGGSINTYLYLWDNGETTYNIDSLSIGSYSITVTDQNNCTSTATYNSINDNNALHTIINSNNTIDVSCFDYCDGEIALTVTGGIPNINSSGDSIYYYLWNDTLFQTTSIATGLCVDNLTYSTEYSCIITDLQGCSDTISYTITQETEVTVDASIVTEILCHNEEEGDLTASASGGAGGYTYLWSNPPLTFNTNPDNNNLPAGYYIVTAQDQNGCIGSDSITLYEPDELTLSIIETSVSCYGFNDGKILADADGGTPFLGIPPEYSYTFYDESSNQVFNENDDVSLAQNLLPGLYTVIANDMNGCTIESSNIYIAEPGDSLTISFSTQDAQCGQDDGQANAYVFGGTSPYQYNWDNGGGSSNISGLGSGYYLITVLDANDCMIKDSAFVLGVDNVFLPNNLSSIEYNICLGDSVFIEIDEQLGTTYQWENGLVSADRWVYPEKRNNIYELTIFDAACLPQSFSVTATVNVYFVDPEISSSPSVEYGEYPTIVKGNSIQISSENDYCDSYTWSWDTITTIGQTVNVSPDHSNWYYINVDSAGCLGHDSIYVVVGVLPYEGITPNNDGYNDEWKPLDIESYPNAKVQIFNRWGAMIFESKGGADYIPWDGKYEGEDLPIGTYYYIIDLNTGDDPQTGPISVIR